MLKFFYGVMNSSKTAQVLIQNYNCHKLADTYTILLKPSTDTRTARVTSRIGLSAFCSTFTPTDILTQFPGISPEYAMYEHMYILIDEAQFCTEAQINQLRELADDPRINVFCYGLKTNFKTQLFEGSKRLLEIADEIEEIPHYCTCGNKAIINARFKDGILQLSGPEVQIGDLEYKPLCYHCYKEEEIKAIKTMYEGQKG